MSNTKIKTAKKTFSQGLFSSFIFLCFRWLVNASTRSPNQHFPGIENSALTKKENQIKSLPLSQSAKSRKKKETNLAVVMNEGHNDLVISQRQSWRNMLISLLGIAAWHSFLASIAKPLLKYIHLIPIICISGQENKTNNWPWMCATTTDRPNYMKQHVSISLSQSTSQHTTLVAVL